MREFSNLEGGEIEVTHALSPIPEGIREQYGGLWVALRARKAVIVAENYDDVVNSPEFNPATDATYHVPLPGQEFYFYEGTRVEGGVHIFDDVIKADRSRVEVGKEPFHSPESLARYARAAETILAAQQLPEEDGDLLAAA